MKLHEKKISELDYIVGVINQGSGPEEGIPKRILKEWAIAVVNDLQKTKSCGGSIKEHMNGKCSSYEDCDLYIIGLFLIDRFELSGDDLK